MIIQSRADALFRKEVRFEAYIVVGIRECDLLPQHLVHFEHVYLVHPEHCAHVPVTENFSFILWIL